MDVNHSIGPLQGSLENLYLHILYCVTDKVDYRVTLAGHLSTDRL